MSQRKGRKLGSRAQRAKPGILLTGFGPFPTVANNATGVLIPKIAEAAASKFPNIAVHHAILPTEWEAGPGLLDDLLSALKPVASIHFGVSDQSRAFNVETTARNAMMNYEDAVGRYPSSSQIDSNGPYTRTIHDEAVRLVEALRSAGIPSYRSDDAGTYLCNRIFYQALAHKPTRRADYKAYFIHLPDDLVGYGDDGQQPAPNSPMTWDEVVQGGLVAIDVALSSPDVPSV